MRERKKNELADFQSAIFGTNAKLVTKFYVDEMMDGDAIKIIFEYEAGILT